MRPNLTINLNAIKHNYLLLKDKVSPALCAAVVKADAYGLGMKEIAPTLQNAGCELFFVATLEEGVELRAILPQVRIAVLNGLQLEKSEDFKQHRLIPVLNTLDELNRWDDSPAMLQVDTGMHRLGLTRENIAKVETSNILYLISHLACADEPDNPKNNEQLEGLRTAATHFANTPLSLAASSGVFLGKEYHLDMVRVGLALYGGNPMPHLPNPMHPIVSLTAPIIAIRTLSQGESIGYGASFVADQNKRVAILPIGYADGLFRCLGNKAEVAVAGVRAQVLGRVSMDLMAVDITHTPSVAIGSEIEILGDTISIEELAHHAGTIAYEVITNLGHRFNRIYR